MNYKEDWSEAQERFKAWWDGEVTDRVVCQVWAPKKGVSASNWEFDPLFLKQCIGFARSPYDPETTIESFEHKCAQTFFGGEAFPVIWPYFGCGGVAAYLGAAAKIGENAVWWGAHWDPSSIMDWDRLRSVEFDPENVWWQTTRRVIEVCLEHGMRKYMVGFPDLLGIYDNLAILRKNQLLIVDMFQRPIELKNIAQSVLEIWHYCYEDLYRMMRDKQHGTTCPLLVWHPKRCNYVCEDSAYILSPKLYKEFVLPNVKEHCKRLDAVIYHLDGIGQLPHVDYLLDIPELNGIQWVPGAGKPHCGSPEWLPLYRKVQKKGKLLQLPPIPPEHAQESARYLLRHLSPKGLMISTWCTSEDKARQFLKELKRFT